MIFHLLYVSQATPLLNNTSDLQSIIEISNERNKIRNVTGVLIKNGPFFIQLLEGKQDQVVGIYNHISRDERHSNVKTLMTYTDSMRLFPLWNMGLVQGLSHEATIQTLIPMLHADVLKLDESKEKVVSILRRFNYAAA